MASRAMVLSAFGAIGFLIGFLAFLASSSMGEILAMILAQLVLDQSLVFATVSGAAGAAISTVVVSMWAKRP